MLGTIKKLYNEYGNLIKDHIYETNKIFLNFIKSKLLFVFEVVISIIIFDTIRPYNDKNYLGDYFSQSNDIFDFNQYFWISFLLLMLYFFYREIISAVYNLFIGSFNFKFNFKNSLRTFLFNFLLSFFLSFLFRDFGKEITLYINSHYLNQVSVQVFDVKKINDDRVKLINDEFGKLSFRKYVDHIDAIRKSKKQTSVYDLEDKDTINVLFKKGFLDELYLE
jgi:ABC-type multidrug transport system fused ATPase/permease subunit